MNCTCDFSRGNWACTCGALVREKASIPPTWSGGKLPWPDPDMDPLPASGEDMAWHAWFSPSARGNYNIYLDKNGNEVKITEVTRDPQPHCNFDDYEYRGIVVKHKRYVRT